jgi:hypothetical protein
MRRFLIVLSCIAFASLGVYSGLWLLRENHPLSIFYLIWFGLTLLGGRYYLTIYKKLSFRWLITFYPFIVGLLLGPVIWFVSSH